MNKLLLTLCFTYFISAEVDLKKMASLLTVSRSQVGWQEIVTVLPVAEHHLNVKSPNQCGRGLLLSLTEQKAECQMKSPGLNELQIFVCDDKNTFCRREVLSVEVGYPTSLTAWMTYLKSQFYEDSP
jgi:hypothetical protein